MAKLFDEIMKFNPYHGKDGRFASADAATSFTYAPGKSTAHSKAIERAKEADEEEKGFKGTLYHGSPSKDIEEFDMERAGKNTSSGEKLLFFTDSKQMAEDFSYERLEGSSTFFQRRGEKGRVYEVDVEMKNPLDFRKLSDADIDNVLKLDADGLLSRDEVKMLAANNHQLLKAGLTLTASSLTELGYDGLIANTGKAGHNALEYAVVDSKQAKIKKSMEGDATMTKTETGVEKAAGTFNIFKADQDKRLVFGWASVAITADGQQIEDVQKDMIDPEDLEEAAYSYVLNFRDTGEEHIPTLRKKGKLVESCVFTKEKQAAIGIPEGIVPEAWWVGFYIEDDEAWEKIKNGTYTMFSIEGKAKRVPVEKSDRFDQIQEVEKFNPYHDERGRFASATGYTSFTFRTKDPKKQKLADMAIAREKERAGAAAAVANPTNDPDTIAGAKRGKPMTHEQADEGRANPNHALPDAAHQKMQAANQKLSDLIYKGGTDEEKAQARKELDESVNEYNKAMADSKQYRINCQSCVVAYEARLRGYDVEAVGKTGKNQIQNKLAEKAETAWIDPATGKMPEPLRNDPSIRTSKQAQKWLEQNVEEGARYEFAHGWKGTNGYHGHIVTVQKEGGSVRIFDPQNGKTYTGDEFTGYMNRVKPTYSTKEYNPGSWSRMKSVPHGRLELLRVDNLQINENVANAVLKGAN